MQSGLVYFPIIMSQSFLFQRKLQMIAIKKYIKDNTTYFLSWLDVEFNIGTDSQI